MNSRLSRREKAELHNYQYWLWQHTRHQRKDNVERELRGISLLGAQAIITALSSAMVDKFRITK